VKDKGRLHELRRRYGPWALVTGASSGIGKEFARRLGRAGLNLVLVARREALLEELAAELSQEHGVDCRVVALDLSRESSARRLFESVGGLDIGLLVNNAGSGWIGRFELKEPSYHTDLIRLHCSTVVELTARFLAPMHSRKRGGLIIVASVAAYLPTPFYSVYGGTKAFLLSWGEALAEELRGGPVDLLVVSPGDTGTGFQEVAGEMSSRFTPVETVVGDALAALGRKTTVVPGLDYRLSLFLARFLPRRLLVKIVARRQRAQTPAERR